MPAQSTFDKRRRYKHKYIRKRPKKDYSGFHYHFNGKQLISGLITLLKHQYVHTCDNPPRTNVLYVNESNENPSCNCIKCGYCTEVAQRLEKKSTELIKYICCKQTGQQHDFPPEDCVTGDCTNGCGIGYILLCLRQHPSTHRFDNNTIIYDKITVVDEIKNRKIYGSQ